MSTRVTIQNIADELGISRNTVSKAINNTGIHADYAPGSFRRGRFPDASRIIFKRTYRRYCLY